MAENSLQASPQHSTDCPHPGQSFIHGWLPKPILTPWDWPAKGETQIPKLIALTKESGGFWLQQQRLKDFPCFCIIEVVYSPESRTLSCYQTSWAVIYRAEYNVVWAELKLTSTGDVAIPLVKICLPGEKKKGRMEDRNVFSSVYLSSSLVSIIAMWLGNSRVQLGQQIFL